MVTSFTETDAFTAAFNEQAATGNKFLVIFTGSINEETNESWCPDCERAKPIIQRVIDRLNGRITILKGITTEDAWMDNEDHPFRQAPYEVEGVPTMCFFEGSESLHKDYVELD